MQEEIFGPLLPVLNIESLSGWISYVESNPRPLALYYFDSNKKRIRRMLQETNSGGVTINDTIYHLAQHNLPFGGNGDSGMGHYHGFDGFETFSKKSGHETIFLCTYRFSAAAIYRGQKDVTSETGKFSESLTPFFRNLG